MKTQNELQEDRQASSVTLMVMLCPPSLQVKVDFGPLAYAVLLIESSCHSSVVERHCHFERIE